MNCMLECVVVLCYFWNGPTLFNLIQIKFIYLLIVLVLKLFFLFSFWFVEMLVRVT
jgi:hypothetical protein